jgi:hypothetical protein
MPQKPMVQTKPTSPAPTRDVSSVSYALLGVLHVDDVVFSKDGISVH